MAKKESALSKVTDLLAGEYLRAITSSGDSVLISKKDLAQALCEVLPAMPATMINIQEVDDLDNIHEKLNAGLYYFRVLGTTLNTPLGSGALLHMQRYDGSVLTSSLMILQIFYHTTSIIYRIGSGNSQKIVFRDWQILFSI